MTYRPCPWLLTVPLLYRREPYTSLPIASVALRIPVPLASWTTRLMSLLPGARTLTRFTCDPSTGFGYMTSNPQYHEYDPRVVPTAPTPSVPASVACSPGYWRSTMGAAAVPVR